MKLPEYSFENFRKLFFFIGGQATKEKKSQIVFYENFLNDKEITFSINSVFQFQQKRMLIEFENWETLAWIIKNHFTDDSFDQVTIQNYISKLGSELVYGKNFEKVYQELFEIIASKFEFKVTVHFMDRKSSQTLTETFSVWSYNEFQLLFDEYIETIPFRKWYCELDPLNQIPAKYVEQFAEAFES